MRVFVVIASLVVLATADVKHLYDAPYGGNKVQTIGSQGSHGSFSGSASGLALSSADFAPQNTFSGQQSTVGFAQPSTGFIQQQRQPSFVQTNKFSGESVGTLPNTGFVSSSYGNAGNSGFGGASLSGFGGSGSTGFGGSGNTGFNAVNSGFVGAVNGGNFQDSSSSGSNAYGSHTTIVKQTSPLISKSSYVFAAPEDDEDIQRDQTIILPRPRQHYKVIFIKAPSTTIVNHPSTAVGGQVQEKTLVYVLSDKKRIENHVQVPEIEQARPQKPEVFFIKYKKPTQVVNTQVKYETVDVVNGAENGAVNGVPNKVSGNSAGLQDEASSPQQAEIAQQIYQSVQSGGLESGVQTVNQLIAGGHSVSGNFQNQAFDTASTAGSQQTFSNGGSQQTFSTGGSQQSFSTGLVQPSISKPALTQHTTLVQSAPALIDSSSQGNGGGHAEKDGYKY